MTATWSTGPILISCQWFAISSVPIYLAHVPPLSEDVDLMLTGMVDGEDELQKQGRQPNVENCNRL